MKILVVEDETDVRELIALHLRRAGHEIQTTDHGEAAIEQIREGSLDLVVLDWMLPGLSGLEVCKKIAGRLPVLMVTARADSADIVVGLDAGADDYITKPFEIPVLLARVNALARRARSLPKDSGVLRIDQLVLNSEEHEVHCAEKSVALTPSEFKLLQALMQSEGKVLTREKLIEMVQGEGISVIDRAIDTHVFGLRKKLGPCSDIIETIRGVGYRIKSNHDHSLA